MRFLLPLIVLAGVASAQNPPAPPVAPAPPAPPAPPRAPRAPRGPIGPGGGFSERRLTQQLGLNAEQQNRVHTAIEEGRVIQQGLDQKESDARTRLGTAVRAGNEAQIDSISQELAQVQQQRIAARAKTLAKIYGTLTPDQKTRIEGQLNRNLGVPGVGGPGGPGPRPRRGPAPPQPPAPPAPQQQ